MKKRQSRSKASQALRKRAKLAPRGKDGRFLDKLSQVMREEAKRSATFSPTGSGYTKLRYSMPAQSGVVVDKKYRTSMGGTLPIKPSKWARKKAIDDSNTDKGIPAPASREVIQTKAGPVYHYYWRWYSDMGQDALLLTAGRLGYDKSMRARWSVGSGYGKSREWVGDSGYMVPGQVTSRASVWKGRTSAQQILERYQDTGEVWFELEVFTPKPLEGRYVASQVKTKRKQTKRKPSLAKANHRKRGRPTSNSKARKVQRVRRQRS